MGNNESIVSTAPPQSTEVVTDSMSESNSSEKTAPKDVVMDENKENGTLKELVVSCGHCTGFVEVSSTHVLSDVRSLIMDEFDNDMIPDEGDFYFAVDDIRLSAKQESRRKAWDLLEKNSRVSIHSKRKKQKVEQEETIVDEETQPVEQPAASPTEEAESVTKDGASTNVRVASNDEETTVAREGLVEEAEQEASSKEQPDEASLVNGNVEPAAAMSAQSTVPSTAESGDDAPAKDGADSARRLLNFNGKFPYSRHSEASETEQITQGEESDPLEHNKDTESSGTRTESSESPMDISEPPKKPEQATDAAATMSNEKDTVDVVMTSKNDDVVIDDSGDDDDEDIVEVEEREDPHKIHDQALKGSCAVLNEIQTLLTDNPLFCSEDRRSDWTSEISETLAKSAPNVVIGVLGNTGVGKSSLLNAILEEASVLPTSGSRGCTAAVVELRFNKDLKDATTEVPVYKGEVEFITLQEWAVELKILIDECSTVEEKTIYARRPEEERQPDASAAWSKIDQVYGRGTMERYTTRPAQIVYDQLINNQRVRNLLTPQQGSTKPHNVISIKEGNVQPEQAKMLLQGFGKIGTRLRRTKKKWAQAFRHSINDYVYRKGNGNLPQTWPLIRKVVLEGPWVALNSGACLVDLPGVRDANAARAKVSEQYLQNCNQIWVVAPIKRAVDDGTAKELLGESFKRRLLMDGQYGNVSFICTQTDDCEATEIMRDHQDVAQKQPGRYERMTDLRDKIMAIEREYSDLVQEEEDLKIDHEEADLSAKEAKEELEEETKEVAEDDSEVQVDVEFLEKLQKTVDEKAEAASQALLLLKTWQVEHREKMQRMQDNIRKLQRRLKSICATVRNEYSTACLQEDFKAGLKELYRKDDEEAEGGEESATSTPLPDDYNMDVFCISANDYLKIEGIKPSSDGPPNTFSKARDTQIPSLRAFVHDTTANFRSTFTEAFCNRVSDMVDRVKLLAADASNVPGGRTSRRCQSLFEAEMKKLEGKVRPLMNDFRRKAESRINSSLQPALKTGSAKGQSGAMSTVTSWGSKSRRTKNERAPDRNGLYYSTYLATVRRDGSYVSKSAGEVNFNQELCDPMEKEFGSDWQRVLDSSIKVFLRETEAKVLALASDVDKAVVSSFAKTGLDKARLATMAGTASRSCTTALKASFQSMREVATNTQRELNRSLLPMVQARMKQGYLNTTQVQGGSGKFMRMKSALEGHSSGAVRSMFNESTTELLKAINDMITQLSSMIAATATIIANTMKSVYSVCWDDQSDKSALMDPAMQQKVRECRDKLLPDLNQLRQKQDETMRLVGIEREELELDVMEVASWEKQNAEKLQKAIDDGDLIDLCESDDETDGSNVARMPPQPASTVRIKADPGATNTVTPSLSSAKPSGNNYAW